MHVQRRAYLASKAIERFLTLQAPRIQRRGSGQLVKAARRRQELMTKTIVVKDSVQIGAKDAPIGADASVQLFIDQPGKWLRVIQIQSFADMNLIPCDEIVSERLSKKRFTKDGAGTETRYLLCLHRCADGE